MYLVQGEAAAGQLAVFGSEPGEARYSRDARPHHQRHTGRVDKLEKKGVLCERATSIRLNCPIIKVGKGG
jgi:hypothetical protein